MRTAAVGIVTALVCAALLPGCDSDRSPTQPNPPGSTATIIRLEILAPASVPPGESVQFRASASLSDGSTRDMTQEVQWSSTNRTVLSISSTGLATAGTRGESTVSIRRASLAGAVKTVMVLPNGTYRLVGSVTEAGSTTNAVADARVEVPSGSGDLTTTTDWSGRYRLYGVPGNAEIRITRDGYRTFVQNVQLSDHITQNFQLALASPRPDISGSYTLKLNVAGGCTGSSPLPDDLRERTYRAILTQNGQEVTVKLTGGDFVINRTGLGDSFRGRVDPAGMTFLINAGDLDYYPYYGPTFYPDVVERLPTQTYLSPNGSASGRFTSWGLSGTLSGSFVVYDSRFPRTPARISTCGSAPHGFQLSH